MKIHVMQKTSAQTRKIPGWRLPWFRPGSSHGASADLGHAVGSGRAVSQLTFGSAGVSRNVCCLSNYVYTDVIHIYEYNIYIYAYVWYVHNNKCMTRASPKTSGFLATGHSALCGGRSEWLGFGNGLNGVAAKTPGAQSTGQSLMGKP